MIVAIVLLKDKCEICGERADFRVQRTNNELPKYHPETGIPYSRSGTRLISYCTKCLPDDVRESWNIEIPDMPDQQV